MCVFVHVCVAQYMCVCLLCLFMCTWKSSDQRQASAVSLHLTLWHRISWSLQIELDWLASKSLGSLCLCIPRSRIIGACQWLLMLLLLLLLFVWVLGNSNADPHACVTGTRETEPSLQLPRYLIKPNNSLFSAKRSVAKTGNWDNVKNFVAVSMIRKWSKKILVSKKHYE